MDTEIFGHWRWSGADDHDESAGVLRTNAKGSLELEMLDELPAPDQKLDLILGRDSGGEPLSLSGLIYSQHFPHRGIKTVFAQQLLKGIALDAVDAPIFDRVVLHFQNLLAIRNASNWQTDSTHKDGQIDYRIQKAEAPAALRATTSIGELELGVGWGTSSSHKRGEYAVSDTASFHIHLPTVGSVDSCLDPWFRPLADLTSFLAQCGCAPTAVSITGPEIKHRGHPHWIEVHRRWVNADQDESIVWPDALSNFSEDDGEFERLILAWLKLHASADRSLAGYFANEWDRVTFMENRFLNAAMAVEGFHRRLYGDGVPIPERMEAIDSILTQVTPEIHGWLAPRLSHVHATSFRKRVRDLTKRAKPFIDKQLIGEDFVSLVCDARNALVHDDFENAEMVPPGGALRFLADALQAVMTFCIADEIGLDLDRCKGRMWRRLNWIESSQHLRTEPH